MKIYIGKIENLKTKRQTKKFDRSFLSIGSSRYVAQFLDHLEHSGYAIVSGEKKSADFPLKIPENAWLQWDPHSKVTSPGGEQGGNTKKSRAKKYFFRT